MALWGNNDAVGSGGTVSLNYSTGAVTGGGTTFGETGAAQEGDVIRFGDRNGTYFGDAVIVSIAGTSHQLHSLFHNFLSPPLLIHTIVSLKHWLTTLIHILTVLEQQEPQLELSLKLA